MKRFLKDGENVDFGLIKNDGFTGIVLECDKWSKEKILSASKCGLEVWIFVNKRESVPTEYLLNIGGRVSVEDKTIDTVLPDTIEKFYLRMDEGLKGIITGFIIPLPDVCGIIWDDSLDSECERLGIDKNNNLIDLFDEEVLESSCRSWYYEQAENLIITKYLLPLKEVADSYEKKISFDIGAMDTQYDLAERMVNPFRFSEYGLSVTLKTKSKLNFETESMILSSGEENFNIIAKDSINRKALNESKSFENVYILLIKPSRGVMERYIRRKKLKYRTETPALIASLEATYYINMLSEKGFCFDCTDEFGLERYAGLESGAICMNGREYKEILICESCRFLDKGIEILKNAEKSGVCINNEALINILGAELEE